MWVQVKTVLTLSCITKAAQHRCNEAHHDNQQGPSMLLPPAQLGSAVLAARVQHYLVPPSQHVTQRSVPHGCHLAVKQLAGPRPLACPALSPTATNSHPAFVNLFSYTACTPLVPLGRSCIQSLRL